jgi:hypothetical protein
MGNKGSRSRGADADGDDGDVEVFDPHARARTGSGADEDELAHMSLRKRIKKKKRETEVSETPKAAPCPAREMPEEIDPTQHVVLKLARDAVLDVSDCCLALTGSLGKPSKVPSDLARLACEVALLDVHVATMIDVLAPLVSLPGARIDLGFNDQSLILADELRQAREAVEDTAVPDSAIGYVGYVATYFASSDVADSAERLQRQRQLYLKQWNRAYKALVGRVERRLTLDDERLALLEQYSEQHGVDLPREYFELVKSYDQGTKDLLVSIQANTRGIAKLARREKRLEAENSGVEILARFRKN